MGSSDCGSGKRRFTCRRAPASRSPLGQSRCQKMYSFRKCHFRRQSIDGGCRIWPRVGLTTRCRCCPSEACGSGETLRPWNTKLLSVETKQTVSFGVQKPEVFFFQWKPLDHRPHGAVENQDSLEKFRLECRSILLKEDQNELRFPSTDQTVNVYGDLRETFLGLLIWTIFLTRLSLKKNHSTLFFI